MVGNERNNAGAEGSLRRRHFLRTVALFTIGFGVACPRLGRLFVGDLAAQTDPEFGSFKVDISQAAFSALQNSSNGSMFVTAPGMPASFAQMIVTRTAPDTFFAVTSTCTHEGTKVQPYDSVFVHGLFCPKHGSIYDPDGEAVSGPAIFTGDLQPYATAFDGVKMLEIQIPGLGYSVDGALVPINSGQRLRLDFNTVAGLHYEVRYRASLSSQWSPISFATTQQGTANQTVLNGTNAAASVFVDAVTGTGFYAVIRY